MYSPTLKKLKVTHPKQVAHPAIAHVLEITGVGGAKNPNPSPTPEWGLHLVDANIALGNLISIVKSETKAFVVSGR